jgi:hypothetical protein
LFAAGTNQQIHFRRSATLNFRQNTTKGVDGELRDFVEAAGREVNGFTRGVINGQAEVQASARGSGGLAIGNGFAQGAGQAVAAADDSSMQREVSARRYSWRTLRIARTSLAGRCQLAEERAKNVSVCTPSRGAAAMTPRAATAPARCPEERGRPREVAQRPLPSEMMATWMEPGCR